jgi:hypothetical protein
MAVLGAQISSRRRFLMGGMRLRLLGCLISMTSIWHKKYGALMRRVFCVALISYGSVSFLCAIVS